MKPEDLLGKLKEFLSGIPDNEVVSAFRGYKAAHPKEQHSILEVGFDLFCDGLDLAATATKLTVVALLHGIRTSAGWQEKARSALEVRNSVKVVPIGYRYMDVVRFLGPWRGHAVERITRELRDLQRLNPGCELVVMAHSFGTYVISKILKDAPDIRIQRLLLCGSIIPAVYRWDQLPHEFTDKTCVNEVGTRDVWPVFARVASWGYGESGSFGFKTARVTDRFFDYGHSDFFTDEHFETFWKPFIAHGHVTPSPWDSTRPTPPWLLSVLGGFPMIKGVLFILVGGAIFFALRLLGLY